MMFRRSDLDGLLWPWPFISRIQSGHQYGLVNISGKFHGNCSSHSCDIVVTRSVRTNEQGTDGCGGRTARKHGFADTVVWQQHEKLYISN